MRGMARDNQSDRTTGAILGVIYVAVLFVQCPNPQALFWAPLYFLQAFLVGYAASWCARFTWKCARRNSP
ncbi:hypothetical protein I41_37360 [Lacipirellula limnantheis]|uniref:Uncharacterized protein n=1 Tax=Lacipirellula limnantheis TaxID=2528024 RepID=A0A517U1M3_9BACT|nr:hypothetical protein I41_37360 [Lacipirellula limnantheis]